MQLSSLERDRLSMQDMSLFVEFIYALMRLGKHEHMFCSGLQLKVWYEMLVGEVEEVVNHD